MDEGEVPRMGLKRLSEDDDSGGGSGTSLAKRIKVYMHSKRRKGIHGYFKPHKKIKKHKRHKDEYVSPA